MTGPDRIRFFGVSSRMPAPRRFGAAFTLIELMVVIVIIGLLSGLAISRFITANAEAQLEGDAQKLLLDLRLAKQAANKTGLRHFILIKTPRNIEVWRANSPTDYTFDKSNALLVFTDELNVKTLFGLGSLPAISTRPIKDFYAPDQADKGNGLTRTDLGVEDCVDSAAYPASAYNSGWKHPTSTTGEFLIQACGSPIADMTEGIAYLTSTQSKDKIYGVGYSGRTNLQLQLFRYSVSAAKWEVL